MSDVKIRRADEKDAEALLEIYSYYVKNTAITFEWEVPTVEEFRKRICNITEKYPYLVAEIDGIPVGYAYANTFRTRAAYVWDVETSIYVSRDYRQKGIGSLLLKRLELELKNQNILNVYAGITYIETEDEYLTHGSVKFHSAMGYEKVAEYRKCGFKFKRWYNVVFMEKFLGEHTDNPETVIPAKSNSD